MGVLAVRVCRDNSSIRRASDAIKPCGQAMSHRVAQPDRTQLPGTAAVFHGWDWASVYDLCERDIIGSRRATWVSVTCWSPRKSGGRGILLAMVLSCGYSAESWKIHADAIEGILTRFEGVT